MTNRVNHVFADDFAPWSITLPDEASVGRQAGRIQQAGWTIQYQWGCDERGEYLDFYAAHRMTNDRHVRLRASGEIESLPSYQEHIIYAPNASPEEIARVERECYEHNRAVAEMLRRKGFA